MLQVAEDCAVRRTRNLGAGPLGHHPRSDSRSSVAQSRSRRQHHRPAPPGARWPGCRRSAPSHHMRIERIRHWARALTLLCERAVRPAYSSHAVGGSHQPLPAGRTRRCGSSSPTTTTWCARAWRDCSPRRPRSTWSELGGEPRRAPAVRGRSAADAEPLHLTSGTADVHATEAQTWPKWIRAQYPDPGRVVLPSRRTTPSSSVRGGSRLRPPLLKERVTQGRRPGRAPPRRGAGRPRWSRSGQSRNESSSPPRDREREVLQARPRRRDGQGTLHEWCVENMSARCSRKGGFTESDVSPAGRRTRYHLCTNPPPGTYPHGEMDGAGGCAAEVDPCPDRRYGAVWVRWSKGR